MKERIESLNKILSERKASFRVEFETVWQNNMEREGYVLRSLDTEKNACPILYQETWYNGKTDEEICDWMCAAYSQFAMAIDTRAITDCDNIRERVLPRVVSADNTESLKRADICYTEVAGGELLACFYLPITLTDGQVASIPLTNILLDLAGISKDEIFAKAIQNMSATIDVLSMDEMLAEMTGVPMDEIPNGIPQLTVVTNKDRLYGSAAILCPELYDILKKRIGHDHIAVLPSSIHEILVTEWNSEADLPRFKEMIREVNNTEVSPEDRLSYSVLGWKNGAICAIA